MTTPKLPRGIRNHNPGNIEWGDPWQGLRPVNSRSDSRFAQFTAPVWGIRALARVLIAYHDKHGIKTVSGAINRWAPPVENKTTAYVEVVAKTIGVASSAKIDFYDYKVMKPFVEAIIRHENGPGPLKTANTWYTNEEIDEGLKLAGIKKPVVETASMPVTKETIGATSVAAVGVAQIAEVIPQITDALSKAESNLSSGSMIRIALGVLTVAFAVFIAYSQIKKHQKELL